MFIEILTFKIILIIKKTNIAIFMEREIFIWWHVKWIYLRSIVCLCFFVSVLCESVLSGYTRDPSWASVVLSSASVRHSCQDTFPSL